MANNEPYHFIKKWKEEQKNKIRLLRPDLSEEVIENFLSKKIKDNFKDTKCTIRNTYKGREVSSSLMNITQFIHNYKPILGGYGVMYDANKPNPAAQMLKEKLAARKKTKKERDEFDKRSFEFLMKDIAQGNLKKIANSYYGAGGAKTSIFYNKDIASSITATGQAEISTSMTSFEMLLSNNIKFLCADECLRHIALVLYDKKYDDDIPKIKNAKEKAKKHILDTFVKLTDHDRDVVDTVFENISDKQAIKLYFINNMKAAILEIPKLYKLIHKIVNKTKTFRNPNKPPKEIDADMEEIWRLIEEFVVFNYPIRERIDRDRFSVRKSIVTQDTDSTMMSFYDLKNFLIEEIAEDEVAAESMKEFNYVLINLCCFIAITKYCRLFLNRYCKIANIPEQNWDMINMKNEFYYPRMLLTQAKKHYVTVTQLQEGKEIDPPLIEIHGLEIAKSETSVKTKKFFEDIIANDIMYCENIDVGVILKKIEVFKQMIKESLESGSTEFLPTLSVKEVMAYKEPYSEQGVRGVIAWNMLYPNKSIDPPDKVSGLALQCKKDKQFELFHGKIPEDFETLIKEKIFNSDEKSIRNNGFNIIAIPQTIDRIPEWLIPMIDYSKIVQDNVSKFNSILESLGIVLLKTRSNVPGFMSNVINL